MANEQNLRPSEYHLTREQAKKGGRASVEAKKRRKALKEELLMLLSDGDVQKRISLALINEAMEGNKAGSVTKAFEVIRDTIGEKPIDRVEQINVDAEYTASVEYVNGLMGMIDDSEDDGGTDDDD